MRFPRLIFCIVLAACGQRNTFDDGMGATPQAGSAMVRATRGCTIPRSAACRAPFAICSRRVARAAIRAPPDAERADVPHDLRPRRDAGTGSDAGNPYNTPTTCTSGTYWMGGDTKSPDMHPGVPCRKCHVLLGSASGKEFDIAGTVYPTAHEPDDCNGLAGVTVVITDANNVDHPFNVTNAGNFYHEDAFGFAKIAVPYKAKVVRNGMTRAMSAAQTDGNCNNCHTETGAQNAPGSIMAP